MLTDTKIRNAKPRARQYRLGDSNGLCVVVMPYGSKLFQLRFRLQGKERTYSIGSYPKITLAEAREACDRARKQISQGVDPVAARKQQRTAGQNAQANTFKKVAQAWFKVWAVGKSERHAGYVSRRLEANVFPAIGSRPIGEIDAPEIVRMLKGIQDRGVSDLAKRVHQMCSQVFRHALAHGFVSRNPAKDFQSSDVLSSPQKRNFACVDSDEIPALLRAVEGYTGTPITRIAIQLLALTFVRTSELLGAEWREIDFEAKRWNIPAERMKMRTQHIVPLSTQALYLLRVLHAITGSGPLLFPGDRGVNRPLSNNTILKALARMGYAKRMTGHGFRSLASTVLHEQGFSHEHIEMQLAHQERNRVAAAYNHAKYLAQRTAMMQAWGDYLDAARSK
jgi:integrase